LSAARRGPWWPSAAPSPPSPRSSGTYPSPAIASRRGGGGCPVQRRRTASSSVVRHTARSVAASCSFRVAITGYGIAAPASPSPAIASPRKRNREVERLDGRRCGSDQRVGAEFTGKRRSSRRALVGWPQVFLNGLARANGGPISTPVDRRTRSPGKKNLKGDDQTKPRQPC
jgi:hypothetical protein